MRGSGSTPRLTALVIARLIAAAVIISALLPSAIAAAQTRPAGGLLDRPLAEQTVAVPAQPGQPDQRLTIHCVTYPGFMVREIDADDYIGSIGISVIPVTASAPATCRVAKSPEARELRADGPLGFVGAAGRFLLLIWADGGNGGTAFAVFDAASARKLYEDAVRDGLNGFSRFSSGPGDDTLDLRYERFSNVPCSLAAGDTTCWSRFARQAKLPAEIARRGPPTAACAAAYAKRNLRGKDLTDPSVVSYPVVMILGVASRAKVVSRGELSCWPSD
jgi:hypothetical protein